MASVLANGVRLNVQRLEPMGGAAADAPIVVMLHGMVIDNLSSLYFTLGNGLASYGAEIVCYDQRGHGRSECSPAGYTLADAMDDLTGVLDGLGIDRPVHLVGNSYGATIALAYALETPERVASLTLIEPIFQISGTLGERMGKSLMHISFGLSDEQVAEWLDESAGRVAAKMARTARKLFTDTTLAQDILTTPAFEPDRLRAMPVPVLAVYGANSDLVHQVEEMESLVGECTMVVLAHHTHSVLREAADYLRMLLRWWLFDRDAPRPDYDQPDDRRFETPGWVSKLLLAPGEQVPEHLPDDAAVAEAVVDAVTKATAGARHLR